MMKHEFDNLYGIVTSPECYERIEFVYMNSDKFSTKQEIADFYKLYDMNGIEKEYNKLLNNSGCNNCIKCTSEIIKSFINDSISDLEKREIRLRNEGYVMVAEMKREAIFELECLLAKIKGYEG